MTDASSSASLWRQTTDVDYMGDEPRANNPSHDIVMDFLRQEYRQQSFTLLDCGVMSGVTYAKLRDSNLDVDYTGIDIGEAILDDCRSRYPEARWINMSATDIAMPADSFDVVNCRHLVENLPYYETAVRELFRVASKHVAISLSVVPRDPEVLVRRETEGGYMWINRYAPGPFEAVLRSFSESVESTDVPSDHPTDRVYLCTKG